MNWKRNKSMSPSKLKAPNSLTSPKRLKLVMQQERLKCKQLEVEISKMKTEIEKASKPTEKNLSEDLYKIFSNADNRKLLPLWNYFGRNKQKYINCSSSSSIKYHPMIIKYCLAIASKSSAGYKELQYDSNKGTGVLFLPSPRTLRDYKNQTRKRIESLCSEINSWEDKIIHGNWKIYSARFWWHESAENLVWDKTTGELIGFLDLGDTDLNYATLQSAQQLATHILVFMVKSIANPLSYSFATFATNTLTSYQLYPVFRKAVSVLEMTCNLKVIATVADGASKNRKFCRIHKVIFFSKFF